MMIPTAMIVLSLVLKSTAGHWANIILGALFTLVNIGNLVGETWAYYLLFGAFEIVLTLVMLWQAWTWPKQAQHASADLHSNARHERTPQIEFMR